MSYVIRCADCKAERTTNRKNTKYCVPCRIYRNIVWIKQHFNSKVQCAVCGIAVAPLERNDDLCAKCDITWRDRVTAGTCSLCEQAGGLLDPKLPICLACAKDPDSREKVRQLAGQLFNARQDAA